MPVRGQRSIWPSAPKGASTIFSRKGSQANPSTDNFCNKDTMNYALGSSTRSKPKGSGGQGLRHQKPKRR